LSLLKLLNNIKNNLSVSLKPIFIFGCLLLYAYRLSFIDHALVVSIVSYNGGTSGNVFLTDESLDSHVAVPPQGHHFREQGFLAEKNLRLVFLKVGSWLGPDNIGRVEKLLFYSLMLEMVRNVFLNKKFYLVRRDLTLFYFDDTVWIPHKSRVISKANQDSRWDEYLQRMNFCKFRKIMQWFNTRKYWCLTVI